MSSAAQLALDQPPDGPTDPDSLLARLGYESFRPGQREAVEAALAGRDALVVMPTGGGKSLCYQLPGLATPELTIVVSPLIALMADQWQRLARDGHPAAMIASGMTEGLAARAMAQVRDGTARLVFCSPERFASAAFRAALAQRKVDLFVIDEAHCVAEWGHDFRPDYLRLPRAIADLGRPAVMACTATATEVVAREISARLGLRDPLVVRSGFDRPNISFDIVAIEGKGGRRRQLDLLEHGLEDPANRPAIVYCGTRKQTEEVASALEGSSATPAAYHAGLASGDRSAAQKAFMGGEVDVVVATNAFGMGVDKADVRSVWHCTIPTSVEAYYQEAGRAGRDGMPSRAVLLAVRSDLSRLVRFIEERNTTPEDVAGHLARLRARADVDGSLELDSPADTGERVLLAIAERAGACTVEPASGGRLALTVTGDLDRARAGAECRAARDRVWRAYHAIKAFSFSETCRRRQLLDHFGDRTAGTPTGRCCDVCDPDEWLAELRARPVPAARPRRAPAADEPELSEDDARLFEALKAWRRDAADGKPAYTVAHDRTLRAIAAARPQSAAELEAIRGVGPTFVARHAEEVLGLVSSSAD